MRFANLLSRFYFEPWGILPDKHAAMGMELQRYMKSEHLIKSLPPWCNSQQMPPRGLRSGSGIIGPMLDGEPIVPQMESGNGVAVITINGVLGKHLSFLDLYCGGCDYDNINAMVSAVNEDPTIETVIFYINSPGGMCIGVNECAAKIAAMRQNTVAFGDYQMCSNGYLLASQCDQVFVSSSSQNGCIGTYIAAQDTSRAWELEGLSLELFRAGKFKGAGMDGKKWTDEERADFQRIVDETNAQFKGAVTAKRPQVVQDTMEGQWFSGRDAVALGLADDFADDLETIVEAATLGALEF